MIKTRSIRSLFVFIFLLFSAKGLMAQCNAGFTVTPLNCQFNKVQCTFTGTAGKPTFYWDFGDPSSGSANTDTLKNPNHIFNSIGNYTITLIIADTGGCRDTVVQNVRIVKKAYAAFTVAQTCAGIGTEFLSYSSKDTADRFLSLDWSYAGGGTDTGISPVHVFTSPGNKSVTLRILTKYGCRDTVTLAIPIFDVVSTTVSKDSACIGDIINFAINVGTTAATSYNWNFGDATNSSAQNTSHQYNASGIYTPVATAKYWNGFTCIVKHAPIKIHKQPDAAFTLLDSVQCYNYNRICIKLKQHGPSLSYSAVSFDDGFVDYTSAFTDSIICHNYTDTSGGKYTISLNIIDKNKCSASSAAQTKVTIYPKLQAKINSANTIGCFKTPFSATNASNQQPPKVTSFLWDFGDGATDATNWSSVSHVYQTNGTFNIRLMITNSDGCKDTFTSKGAVQNTSYVVDAEIDSALSVCRSTNLFQFRQTPVSGAKVYWDFGNLDTAFKFNVDYHYRNVGVYYPKIFIDKNGCTKTHFMDSVVIFGPQAMIGNIANQYQCSVRDTVTLNNTSTYFRNRTLKFHWDLNDPFAPGCTSDTKNGININNNCNYSVDSTNIRHMYTPGQERCYFPQLIVTDSLIGCTDTAKANLPLIKPNAQTGVKIISKVLCLGPEKYKEVQLDLSGTKPGCAQQKYWVMWDSTCARASGLFDSGWKYNQQKHNYGYNICDSTGKVSVGIVIQNGLDSNNKACTDTGWYHDILDFGRVNPGFTSSYDPKLHYCKNSEFTFYITDTHQDSLSLIRWEWGDGSSDTSTNTAPVKHRFRNAGVYRVILYLELYNGCAANDTLFVNVGYSATFGVTAKEICLGLPVTVVKTINYWKYPTQYWSDTLRRFAGLESLEWDLGDGKGYSTNNPQPTITYPRIGNYTIKLASLDSAGCRDTLIIPNAVRVFTIKTKFSTLKDTFTCAQLIPFKSNVSVYDSVNNFGHPDDKVSKYLWTFGTGLSNSVLSNPTKFLRAGNYTIKLLAENMKKCKDSFYKSITILGPTAHYSFTGDSTGCQALKVSFKNKSDFATAYTWNFGDASNSSIFTNSDTNVSFTYPQYGSFYPKLTAQISILNNGIPITCKHTFPDTPFIPAYRRVTVFENPKPDFNHITDCNTYKTAFSNISVCLTDTMTGFLWDFGDGDTSMQRNPTHQFADTGRYMITLTAYSRLGCMGTIKKQIVIAPYPVVWFRKKDVCVGHSIQFIDSTIAFNDQIVKWQWNFDDNTSSILKNPLKTFATDTIYKVKLTVTNGAGCNSNGTRNVKVFSRPKTNFSFTNKCLTEAIPLNNTTTTKETPVKYFWTLGDGDTTSATSLTKTYIAKGNYNVKLKATNWFGCDDSITKEVTTYPLPVVGFSMSAHDRCLVGNSFTFTNSSSIDTGGLTYQWAFGSYSYSTLKNPVQNYDTAGKFTIRMISSTVYNCRDTAFDTVRIYPNPVSRMVSPASLAQCINTNRFTFIDSTKILTGQYTLKWDLGDNNSSSNSTVTHRYADTGNFNLRLMTMSDKNCPDTLFFKTRVHPKPRADFSINNVIQCVNGNSYAFTNTSTGYYGATTSRWFFGDNDSSQNLNAGHVYLTHDTFNVKLIATNNTLCSDTISKVAIVYTKPSTSFIIRDSIACERDNIFLFRNTSNIAYGTMTYTWKYGDGKTASTFHTQHSYDTFGAYPVELIALSDHGCKDTARLTATVFPMPAPGFTVNDRSQCINSQDFIFTNTTTIGTGSFSSIWDLGEKDTAMTQNARKQFGQTGPFKIVMHIKSDHNCVDSASMQILIHPKPYPSFSVNDSTQCINDQLFSFSNSSVIQKGSLTYVWQLGNGVTANTTGIVNYRYPNYGTYNVKLTATSDSGCVDSFARTTEVFPKPATFITANDSGQCVNANLFQFHANYTIPYGNIRTWFWNLGGTYQKGSQDTFKNYRSDGSFGLILITVSDDGCGDTANLNITVYPKPKSLFSINDTAQCENDNLFVFTNKSSFAFGPLTYLWDLGNGSNDTATSVQKTYLLHDTMAVSLIAFTGFDCRDTFSSTIIVHPKPNPSYTVNDSAQCINGNKFIFNNTSKIYSGTMTYTWETGDGYSAGQLDTGHIYSKEGTYKVMLRALSSEGCRDSFARTDTVYPKPYPAFLINKNSQCLNEQLYLYSNKSTIAYGKLHYEWQTGDTYKTDSTDIRHIYPNYGFFNVQLRAISEKGCSDSTSKTVRVFAKPMMQFAINDTDQCINSQNMQFSTTAVIPEGKLINYKWTFGDGANGTGTAIGHYYQKSAFYTVTHTAVSDSLCVDSVKRVVRIFPKPVAKFHINDSAQCIRSNYYIFNEQSFDSSGIKIYHWEINKSVTAYTPSIRYNFNDTGYQFIELIVTSNNGCSDTATREAFVKQMPDPSFAKLAAYYCQNSGMVNLNPAKPGGTFYGKNINTTFFNPQTLWGDTVKYIVTVNGCTDSSEQYTKVYPPPTVKLGNDTQLCLYEYVELNAQSWNATYKWNTTGNNYPTLKVNQPGIYSVTAVNICGTDSDTIRVSFKDINCRFVMPTAFSPNGDEINEYYKPVTVNVPVIKMEIFNRWGEKIYEGDQDAPGWDGTYKGEKVAQDVYLYLVYYRYPTGEKWIELNEKGTFHLLR